MPLLDYPLLEAPGGISATPPGRQEWGSVEVEAREMLCILALYREGGAAQDSAHTFVSTVVTRSHCGSTYTHSLMIWANSLILEMVKT